ncbi:MAG: hypothetical protein ACNA7Z_06650 [Dethiobacteria bacterium]|nr:hypothetical protein [Bacillota bacterium]
MLPPEKEQSVYLKVCRKLLILTEWTALAFPDHSIYHENETIHLTGGVQTD